MKKTKFTESQIVAAIRKQESGVATKEVCREWKHKRSYLYYSFDCGAIIYLVIYCR